ncbi:MAG: hypothetical protein GYB42_03905 [Alphaproteobacteria bacterium]|nr:hypothetical protein [Alphaproteobacteria bacterium]
MSKQDILDLSQVDPSIWRVMVKDTVYGPYTLGQMRSFALEGRLTPHSRTAEGDGGAFIPASEQAALRPLFLQRPAEKTADAPARPANHIIVLKSLGDSRHRVIRVLNTIGRFVEIMPETFLVHTPTRTPKIRELINEVLDEKDRVVIVNASNGRLGWIGLGPELDSHIRAVWKRPDAKPSDPA